MQSVQKGSWSPILTNGVSIYPGIASEVDHLRSPQVPILQMSLSRLNYQWPEWEVHPEMMEGVAARNLCLQRGLKG